MVGALESVPGVESADVDFGSKTATVVVKGAVTDEMLCEAVAAGEGSFSAEVKQ